MYFNEISFYKYCRMNSEETYKNTLIKFDLQTFLKNNEGITSLQLKKPYPDLYKLLAAQILLYPKAAKKLPLFTSRFCFLTSKSYEQSSSEALANYKASLFKGSVIIDLTGGLGIDDIAFSKIFENVVSVDSDKELNMLAEVNFMKLNIKNIERYTSSAETFIQKIITADLVYIDADRRMNSSGKKAITLHDSSPNIPGMMNRLFEISPVVLLKLSPLIDITYIKRTLKHVKEIRIVSLNGEVKEILVLLDISFKGESEAIAVEVLPNGGVIQFSSLYKKKILKEDQTEQKYFFEPAPALIKAGLVKSYAEHMGLNLLFKNNIYYTSGYKASDFFGRTFILLGQFPFSKSAFIKYLRENNITYANFSCRNFPVKPETLKKLFGITDGGEDYFFFITDDKKNKLVYHCRKI